MDDLKITQFTLTNDSEFILSTPSVPLTLGAGEDQRCDLTYAPNTWGGDSSTTVHIVSNDPRQPTLDIAAIGSAPRNFVLIIGLVVLGAAVVVGGAEIYEHAKEH